jgi:hypothetical protein
MGLKGGLVAKPSFMKPMKVLVSLIIADSEYQQAQAAAAEEVARGLNLRIEVVYAGIDAVHQTQQLVKANTRSREPS